MARKALIEKAKKEPKYSARKYTRCQMCGRPHSVIKKYKICRVCFRNMASEGKIPGVKKSSW